MDCKAPSTITLSIAGYTIAIQGVHESQVLLSLPDFAPFVVTDVTPQWTVYFGQPVIIPNQRFLYAFDFDDSLIHCVFSRSDNNYYFTMHPSDTTISPLRLRYPGGTIVYADRAANATMLRFALWMSFALMGMQHGVLPIHASTIMYHDRAVLFLGESGTGKSTHSRLWTKYIAGASLLNDDSPIITTDEGNAIAYGSPWSGKTPCYKALRIPVAGIVRLRQAQCNTIHRLDTVAAIAAIQPSLPPALAYDAFTQRCQMQLVSDILSTTRVYRLHCLPDKEAALLCCETIFGS